MKNALLRVFVVLATILLAAGIALAQHAGNRFRVSVSRNPFIPPRELYAAQDLPALRVTVIGYNREQPARSLAVVRLETQPPVRRVVYTGDRIGEYRILRIEHSRVLAAAPAFGGTTRVSLSVGDTIPSTR